MPQIRMLKKVRVFLTVCEAFELEPVLAYGPFKCAICKDGDPVSAPLQGNRDTNKRMYVSRSAKRNQ